MGIMAGELNLSPRDLFDMDIDDLFFWLERVEDYQNWMKDNHANIPS
jgi:hypothetical protein